MKTIQKNVTAQIIEKKSKFIADFIYVTSQEQAEKELQIIKKRYYDAKHHCFAYRIMQKDGIVERASDDGEPTGTAGGPILNLLQKIF